MQLFGYSERGFVNAFFYEVFRREDADDIIRSFLRLAEWPLAPGRPALIESVSVDTVLVEQSFSDFGDADVLVLASSAEGKVSFFFEAKRGRRWRIKKEWVEFKARFQNSLAGGVSNVFRQLYLKQRLVQALVSRDDLGVGIEFDGVLRPTRGTRRRKIGTNKVVLKAVDELKPYIGSAYYLVLTPEPWSNEGRTLFQDINTFDPSPTATKPRAWGVTRWGVISLGDVVQLCKVKGLSHTVAVADFNDGQLY